MTDKSLPIIKAHTKIVQEEKPSREFLIYLNGLKRQLDNSGNQGLISRINTLENQQIDADSLDMIAAFEEGYNDA